MNVTGVLEDYVGNVRARKRAPTTSLDGGITTKISCSYNTSRLAQTRAKFIF